MGGKKSQKKKSKYQCMCEKFFTILKSKEIEVKQYCHWLAVKLKKSKGCHGAQG